MIESTVIVKCDGLDCTASRDIPSPVHLPVEWGEYDGFTYCPDCWPKVQQETEEEEE